MEKEKTKHANAAFVGELDSLICDLNTRFDVYLKNDFLVLAALLDPRYTFQVEQFIGNSLSSFVPKFVKVAEKLSKTENKESANETETQILTTLNANSIWGNFPSVPTNATTVKDTFKYDLEVIKLNLRY